MKLFKMYN